MGDLIKPDPSRRTFLKVMGGLTASFLLPVTPRDAAAADTTLPFVINSYPTVDAWIRINPQGTVAVFSGKDELGQGVQTAICQILAEELDVNMSRVEMVNPDTARSPEEFYTAGSASIKQVAWQFVMPAQRSVIIYSDWRRKNLRLKNQAQK